MQVFLLDSFNVAEGHEESIVGEVLVYHLLLLLGLTLEFAWGFSSYAHEIFVRKNLFLFYILNTFFVENTFYIIILLKYNFGFG